MTLHAGGLTIQVISPPSRAPGPAPEDPNQRAVTAIVSSGAFDLSLFNSRDPEPIVRERRSLGDRRRGPRRRLDDR